LLAQAEVADREPGEQIRDRLSNSVEHEGGLAPL